MLLTPLLVALLLTPEELRHSMLPTPDTRQGDEATAVPEPERLPLGKMLPSPTAALLARSGK